MPSYQEMEVKISQLERKVDFLMRMGSATVGEESITEPKRIIKRQISLLDLYHMLNQQDIALQKVLMEPEKADPDYQQAEADMKESEKVNGDV